MKDQHDNKTVDWVGAPRSQIMAFERIIAVLKCVESVPVATTAVIREKVMDSGRGSQSGQYKIVNEAKGRNRIANNTVSVNQISRNTGDIHKEQLSSWDTVIIVHE